MDDYFVTALSEILTQAATAHMFTSKEQPLSSESILSTSSNPQLAKLTKLQQAQSGSSSTSQSSSNTNPDSSKAPDPSPNNQQATSTEPLKPNQYSLVFLGEPLSSRISLSSANSIDSSDPSALSKSPPTPSILDTVTNANKKLQRSEQDVFHRNLRVLKLETRAQVEATLREKIDVFKGYYGVLQFLYSVILTKVSF